MILCSIDAATRHFNQAARNAMQHCTSKAGHASVMLQTYNACMFGAVRCYQVVALVIEAFTDHLEAGIKQRILYATARVASYAFLTNPFQDPSATWRQSRQHCAVSVRLPTANATRRMTADFKR